MNKPIPILATLVLLAACSPSSSDGASPAATDPQSTATAQQASGQKPEAEKSELEVEREQLLSKWGAAGVPRPGEVSEKAEELLSRPLEEQSEPELTEVAEEANRAANFVGFILEKYADYYRDNYQYEFIQRKIAPYHDAYVQLANRLKSYRDRAYLNLGLKAKDQGDFLHAFFYFRDAFRLSSFTEDGGDHKGTRYQAEVEMKKLLGIEKLGTFVYWK